MKLRNYRQQIFTWNMFHTILQKLFWVLSRIWTTRILILPYLNSLEPSQIRNKRLKSSLIHYDQYVKICMLTRIVRCIFYIGHNVKVTFFIRFHFSKIFTFSVSKRARSWKKLCGIKKKIDPCVYNKFKKRKNERLVAKLMQRVPESLIYL